MLEHDREPLIVAPTTTGHCAAGAGRDTRPADARARSHKRDLGARGGRSRRRAADRRRAGDDAALRSWHVDGTPGPLKSEDAHYDSIRALAVLEHDREPVIVSAGDDGALRSWHADGTPGPLARARPP